MNQHTCTARLGSATNTFSGMQTALLALDPFQRWEHTDLEYVQEEMRDHDAQLDENERNDRARWGHD